MSVSNQTPLIQLAQVLVYFTEWEEYVAKCDLPTQCMLSVECRDDLKSYILGLTGFVNEFLRRYPMCSVKLGIGNSDVVEIFFCCQRALLHGANTNPSYKLYAEGINTVTLLAVTHWPWYCSHANVKLYLF